MARLQRLISEARRVQEDATSDAPPPDIAKEMDKYVKKVKAPHGFHLTSGMGEVDYYRDWTVDSSRAANYRYALLVSDDIRLAVQVRYVNDRGKHRVSAGFESAFKTAHGNWQNEHIGPGFTDLSKDPNSVIEGMLKKLTKKVSEHKIDPKVFKTIEQYIAKIHAPHGFKKESGVGHYDGESGHVDPGHMIPGQPTSQYVLIASPGEKIVFNISLNQQSNNKWGGAVWGSTFFLTEKGWWVSFDQRGIGPSFGDYDMKGDPNKEIADQIARIEKARAASKSAMSVPGLPYTIQPDRKERFSKELKAGKSVQFTPHGMGQGHMVIPNRKAAGRYAKPASKELEKFFGVTPLWIDTFDYD